MEQDLVAQPAAQTKMEINNNCIRYTDLPLVHKGAHGTPLGNHFPVGIF